MTTKASKAKKSTAQTVVEAVDTTTPKAPSAMDVLRAAASSAKPTMSVPQGGLISQVNDPAIAGATRKGKSGVVVLGVDPGILEDAKEAADLAGQIKSLTALFSVKQASLRDYGSDKRKKYNKIYRTDVTTVNVPYTVKVDQEDKKAPPAHETRFIQVVCSNKYSVSAEPVLAGKETVLGDWFGQLFNTETTKTLRPNAEELFRNILIENGILGENLDKAMELLFEEKTKVTTVEAYEALEQEAPEEIRTFLSQSVTRVQPGLKFAQE